MFILFYIFTLCVEYKRFPVPVIYILMVNTNVKIILYLCINTMPFLKVWKGFVVIHKTTLLKVWSDFLVELLLTWLALQLVFFCIPLLKVPWILDFSSLHPTILWTPLWMDELFVNVYVVTSVGVQCETSEAKNGMV